MTTGSVAYADPPDRTTYDPVDRTTYNRDTAYDRDHDRSWFTRDLRHRYDRYDGRYGNTWVPIARRNSAATDRQQISMRGRVGRFNRLRVEAVRGAPVIQRVVVEYANGNAQSIEMNTRLRVGAGETIRLDRDRRISRITVYTEPTYRGAYSIYGA